MVRSEDRVQEMQVGIEGANAAGYGATPVNDLPLLLSVADVCRALGGIGRTHLYDFLGKPLPMGLPVIRIGRLVRVHRDDLIAFIEARRQTW